MPDSAAGRRAFRHNSGQLWRASSHTRCSDRQTHRGSAVPQTKRRKQCRDVDHQWWAGQPRRWETPPRLLLRIARRQHRAGPASRTHTGFGSSPVPLAPGGGDQPANPDP